MAVCGTPYCRRCAPRCCPGWVLARHGRVAENLWQQARALIGERARLWQARLHVQTEQRAAILREIGEAMITSFNLADVLDVIAWELPRLGVTACYLSLFENPTDPAYRAPDPGF